MFVCPRTQGPLKGLYSPGAGVTYPTVDGVPVLLLDPREVVERSADPEEPFPSLFRTGVPDLITPHLPAAMLGAPAGLGQWFAEVGDLTPDQVLAGYGVRHAPAGPSLDAGCGVGGMVRRMVSSGRTTYALDVNADSVLLARRLLTGQMGQALIPTHRSGLRRVKVPFKPISTELHFCVADITAPPFLPGTFAWIHLGQVLEGMGDGAAEALVSSANLLMPGGLLTISTSYAGGSRASETAPPPEEELLEALDALGLSVVEQRDRVPWVEREYDRSFRVRFIHCLAARRE